LNTIALIPARYDATRFPGKLMQQLAGKSVIRTTYESTVATGLFDDVAVVCDSPIIFDEIVGNGGKAILSQKEHECGTDRIAEALVHFPQAEIIVNVQGDEPFTQKEPLEKLLQVFENADGVTISVASLMQQMHDTTSIQDPNYVKVAVDIHNNALFFSRSVIPFPRNKNAISIYYEHIGIYAFRRAALQRFTQLPVSPLEDVEKIECLRYLENGMKMKMVITDYMGIEIDTPEDLVKAEKYL
jgi:3-deoxy-D-manno-octulosonate cytidylyltransferase